MGWRLRVVDTLEWRERGHSSTYKIFIFHSQELIKRKTKRGGGGKVRVNTTTRLFLQHQIFPTHIIIFTFPQHITYRFELHQSANCWDKTDARPLLQHIKHTPSLTINIQIYPMISARTLLNFQSTGFDTIQNNQYDNNMTQKMWTQSHSEIQYNHATKAKQHEPRIVNHCKYCVRSWIQL